MFRLWTPDGYLHIASSEQLKELNKLGDDHLRVTFTNVLSKEIDQVESLKLIFLQLMAIYDCHYVSDGLKSIEGRSSSESW